MTKKNHSLSIFLLLFPGVGFIALMLAAALVMTMLQSLGLFNFTGVSQLGLHEWREVFNEQTWDAFAYSTKIAFTSSLMCMILAYPLALYLRREFLAKKFFNAIIRMPLFMPALVAAFLILNVIAYHGIFNEFLIRLGIIREPLRLTHDDWGLGVVGIQIWKNLPFQTLIVTSVLASIQSDLENAAKNLGAGPWHVFRDILFPLSIPGIVTGVVLVFIGIFGDYAINTVAGPNYPPSLAIRMYVNANIFNDWGQSACTAIIIIVSSMVYAWLITRVARFATR
jgi:putative spermidine/putrescine transport system permease protein